jgi:hypothetical protein
MSTQLLNRIERTSALLVVVGALAWTLASTWMAGVSVLAGGAVALGNFMMMRIVIERVFRGIEPDAAPAGLESVGPDAPAAGSAGARRGDGAMAFLMFFKFGILAAVLFVCVRVIGLDLPAFAVGLSLVVASMVGCALRHDWSDASGSDAAAEPATASAEGRMG